MTTRTDFFPLLFIAQLVKLNPKIKLGSKLSQGEKVLFYPELTHTKDSTEFYILSKSHFGLLNQPRFKLLLLDNLVFLKLFVSNSKPKTKTCLAIVLCHICRAKEARIQFKYIRSFCLGQFVVVSQRKFSFVLSIREQVGTLFLFS